MIKFFYKGILILRVINGPVRIENHRKPEFVYWLVLGTVNP